MMVANVFLTHLQFLRFYIFHSNIKQLLAIAILAVAGWPLSPLADEGDPFPAYVAKEGNKEEWIYSQLKTGQTADLGKYREGKYACKSKVKLSKDSDCLKLTSETPNILLRVPFLYNLLRDKEIPAVHITGASFQEKIIIRDQSVSKSLNLSHSCFGEKVDFHNAKFSSDLVIDGSHFAKDLDLSGTSIGGTLSARHIHVREEFNLRHARISQDFYLSEAQGGGEDPRISESDRSIIGGIFTANSANIRGQFTASHALFLDKVNMQFLSVGEDLIFRHDVEFRKRVDLRSASLKGRLNFAGARIKEGLDLTNTTVGDSLILCGIRAGGKISLLHTNIGNDLDLSRSRVDDEFMGRGLSVKGDLIFDYLDNADSANKCRKDRSSSEPEKSNGSRQFNEMNLQDARVELVHDRILQHQSDKKEPKQRFNIFEIDGFVHKGLYSGRLANDGTGSPDRNSDGYLRWLAQDQSFTTQPYQHIAGLLKKDGRHRETARILFKSRQEERKAACSGGDVARCTGLSVLELTVGYGIGARSFRVLWWLTVLSFFGGYLIWSSEGGRKNSVSFPQAVWASFDYMLPLIELDSAHKELVSAEVHGWRKQLLYIQALLGWLLASFVIAAVAGLTQGG